MSAQAWLVGRDTMRPHCIACYGEDRVLAYTRSCHLGRLQHEHSCSCLCRAFRIDERMGEGLEIMLWGKTINVQGQLSNDTSRKEGMCEICKLPF